MRMQAVRSREKLEDEEPIDLGFRMNSRRREERTVELCEAMIDVASALYNVSSKELREPGRSSIAVTRVRQIAMYVVHVVCGLSMREVGIGFGRDRTTVLHACHLVEDLRDDEEFDRVIGMTERIAQAAFGRWTGI